MIQKLKNYSPKEWIVAMDVSDRSGQMTVRTNGRSSTKCDWENHTLAECVKKHECDVLFVETMEHFGRYIRYYDTHSFELLDEKIAVMTALKEGKRFDDIPDSKKILERMDNIDLFMNPNFNF